jgi:tetratricopeptide (TPR) repeat protein
MDVFVDGMNLSYLRKLTKSCLGESAGTSLSPSMAVFYASILHSKTKSYNDAFLYGQALFQNHDYKRCVEWMENSGLLQCSCSSSSSNNNNFPSLQLESILLTATALLKLQDWNAILALLEETHLYASVVGYDTHSLQDDDDIAWMTLKENISALIPSNNDIHPLARICAIRGRAYSELGHPLRAAHFWKKALHIDPTCVDALEGLVLRNAVNPHEALAIVLGLEFDASENLEWLRALYLARVHVAAPTSSNIPDSSAAAEALATSMSMEHSINPQESPIEHNGENQQHAHNNITAANHDRQAVAPGTHHEPTGMIDVESTGEPFTPFAQQPGASFLFSGRANDSQQDRDESYTAIYQTRNNPVTAASRAAEQALDRLVSTYKLQESPEVLAMAAQQAFGRYQFHKCLQCCQALIQCNSMQGKAAFCYVSTLVQLRQKRTLFRLAHEWVEAAPKEARSWFAVGAYYYACQRYHV